MRALLSEPKPGSGESLLRKQVSLLPPVCEFIDVTEFRPDSFNLSSARAPFCRVCPALRQMHGNLTLLSTINRYMREGLSHDDIYIMVEDEFLSTAQLFTSHLHHAEYVRLKIAAKARNASSLLPNSNAMSRPTDSITTMRAETKKKKEAEARMGKNKAALDKMKSDARSNIALTTDDDLGSEDEEDEQPWAGTSLQGLMAPAARKNLTSLSGLQGIQSSTRAANGYSKPKPDDPSQSQNHRPYNPIKPQSLHPATRIQHPSNPSTSNNHRPTLRRLSDMSSSNESSDDLDAPSTRPSRPSSTKTHTISNLPPPRPNPTNPLSLAASDLFDPAPRDKKHHVPNHSPPRKQKSHHKSPNSSPPSRKDDVAAARRRLEQRRERAAAATAAVAAKKMDENTNGSVNINEIPVFLV
ncbi:MAG: hypothetical protein Q9192_007408 [Flavoplaca navasiana]